MLLRLLLVIVSGVLAVGMGIKRLDHLHTFHSDDVHFLTGITNRLRITGMDRTMAMCAIAAPVNVVFIAIFAALFLWGIPVWLRQKRDEWWPPPV